MNNVALCENQTREAAQTCANQRLVDLSAPRRVEWALEHLPSAHMVSSSFGAQSAVMLHLLSQVAPRVPVVLVDTGYLFPETYQFVDELRERLDLNLSVYRPRMSPAWQEALYGKRWEQGLEALEAYNRDNKVEPMQRALDELGVGTWFAGLRRDQSAGRARRDIVESSGQRWKVHPIVDWTDRDVHRYLTRFGLPYHPLWQKGYVSIGDWHTTRSLAEVDNLEDTRFFGLKRECGLHEGL